jgi:hypothetical protein
LSTNLLGFLYITQPAVEQMLKQMSDRHLGMVAQDVEQVFPSWVDKQRTGIRV